MPRRLKIILISLTLVIGLLLLSMLLVPWQIKKQSSQWIADNTTRTLTFDRVFFNPFTLRLEINGVILTEQDRPDPFVAFERVMVSVSPHSLLRRALILSRVEIDAPYLSIELQGEQYYNFSDFVSLFTTEEQQAVTSPEEQRPFHFSLNNIVVTGGALDFIDYTSATQAHHRIRQLDLSIPFIGNIPFLLDEYVEPNLRLLLNDAEIIATGRLKPFHDSLETQLFIDLSDLDLAFYAYHSPVPLPIVVRSGVLDINLDLSYRVFRTEDPQLLIGGLLLLSDLMVEDRDTRNLLDLPLMAVDLDWANLFQRDVNLAMVELHDPRLWINRNIAGLWNLETLIDSAETTEATETTTATEGENTPFFFNVARLTIFDGEINFVDEHVSPAVVETLHPINLDVHWLNNHPHQRTTIGLALRSARDVAVDVSGELIIEPLSAAFTIAIDDLPLQPYYPYLEPWLTRSPQGSLNLSARLHYSPQADLQISTADILLRELLVPFDDNDHLHIGSFRLLNGTVNLHDRKIVVDKIALSGTNLGVTQLAAGKFSPELLVREQQQVEEVAEEIIDEIEEDHWTLVLNSFVIEDTNIRYTDNTMAARPQTQVNNIRLTIDNLHYPTAATSPYSFSARHGTRGRIDMKGQLVYAPLNLTAHLTLDALALDAFNDFIPPELGLELRGGLFYTDMNLAASQTNDTLKGSFSGNLHLTHFALRDPLGTSNMIAWDNLGIKGIAGDIEPFRLHIQELVLSDYLAAIQITPEGQINLTGFGTPLADDATAVEDDIVADVTSRERAPADIRIDAVTLQGGTVSFVDRHMPRVFATTMYDLGGRISGMSSAADMLADVDLRGRLENHSPLTISGKINPLSEDLYLDLTLSFSDIDLTPMTPYAGTYLGYTIDRGKLYLDLSYHIEQQRIRAANRIKFDQFNLGERVESDQATSLPIRLAIALLKDRNDEINLNIPVSGNLDDPNFSLAGTIFTVLRNLLVRAATSPFSLLTAMLGSDKDYSGVEFAPGIARLDEDQWEKLRELAGVLLSRPAFNLEISGFVDPDNDPEAYRHDRLQQMLYDALWQDLQRRGTAPESREDLVIDDENHAELLLHVYEHATFPRPRNIIGMLTKLPDEEMEKLLLAHILVEEEQLEELARDRALAVRNALESINAELAPRLFLKKMDIFAPADEGPSSRVELGIIPR